MTTLFPGPLSHSEGREKNSAENEVDTLIRVWRIFFGRGLTGGFQEVTPSELNHVRTRPSLFERRASRVNWNGERNQDLPLQWATNDFRC